MKQAYERLYTLGMSFQEQQEKDFAQWLRDELEWARSRLRLARSRLLTDGSERRSRKASATAIKPVILVDKRVAAETLAANTDSGCPFSWGQHRHPHHKQREVHTLSSPAKTATANRKCTVITEWLMFSPMYISFARSSCHSGKRRRCRSSLGSTSTTASST